MKWVNRSIASLSQQRYSVNFGDIQNFLEMSIESYMIGETLSNSNIYDGAFLGK